MASTTPPTDQRAGACPISFVLSKGGSIGAPLTLVVRPEDLTRNQPSRISVNQTLGRDVCGWVDNFGEGLPSITIAGHTGWGGGGRPDGAKGFDQLNQLVAHEYHEAKQAAIDSGTDPATVQLIFADLLDDFTYSVAPTTFVLRRSRSRPLLFQYNITLQAVSTSIDTPFMVLPFNGGLMAGLGSLGSAISKLQGFVAKIKGMVASAVSYVTAGLSPIANTAKQFANLSTGIFTATRDAIGAIQGGASSVANNLIGIAHDMAKVGVNVFRTISAIEGLPSSLKAELTQVASAYNEVVCIFRNSLRPALVYEDYNGLYGASNCSSTTGGNQASIYADRNAFDLLRRDSGPVSMSSSAIAGVNSLSRSDPVLAPTPINEMNRLLNNVVNGVLVVA